MTLIALMAGCGGLERRPSASDPARDALYAQAERHYTAGRFKAACEGLKEVAQRASDPDERGMALYRCGQAHLRMGQPEQAKAVWRQAVETGAYERGALARLRTIELEASERSTMDTLDALADLAARWPDSVAADTAVKQMARVVQEAAEPASAQTHAVARLDALSAGRSAHRVGDNAAFMALHIQLFQRGDLGEARTRLRAMTQRFPGSPLIEDVRWTLAAIHRRQGEWDRAAATYAAMIDNRSGQGFLAGGYRHPKLDEAAELVGAVRYHALQDCVGAVEAWRRTLEEFPTSKVRDDAWWGLARCSARLGDHAAAEEALNALLKERPDSRFADQARAVQAGEARLDEVDPPDVSRVASPLLDPRARALP